MRTREEVIQAFTPSPKLSDVQKTAMLKVEMAFKDLATDVVDLVPESADRTAALRKLLEAKFTCIQAITHAKTESAQKLVQTKEKENAKEKAPSA